MCSSKSGESSKKKSCFLAIFPFVDFYICFFLPTRNEINLKCILVQCFAWSQMKTQFEILRLNPTSDDFGAILCNATQETAKTHKHFLILDGAKVTMFSGLRVTMNHYSLLYNWHTDPCHLIGGTYFMWHSLLLPSAPAIKKTYSPMGNSISHSTVRIILVHKTNIEWL